MDWLWGIEDTPCFLSPLSPRRCREKRGAVGANSRLTTSTDRLWVVNLPTIVRFAVLSFSVQKGRRLVSSGFQPGDHSARNPICSSSYVEPE